MKSNNILEFLEEIIPAANMVNGDDFEIISFFGFDRDELETFPINRIFGINVLSIVKGNKGILKTSMLISSAISQKNLPVSLDLSPTPYPENPCGYFYRLVNRKIDYDTAISLGFGIVRMLKAPNKGEFWLYNFGSGGDEDYEEDDVDDEVELHDELMMLKCYLQLTEDGRFHDPNLADYIDENIDLFYLMLFCEHDRMIEKILMSLDGNKGELIIFPN